MRRLDRKQLEPQWITVREAVGEDPAVRVLMRPIGIKAWRAAQTVVGQGIVAAGGALTDDVTEELGDDMSLALIKAGLIEWEGVGDLDGKVVEPTPDTIVRDADGKVIEVIPGTVSLFLADPRDFDSIDAAYVIPFMNREREKNGSSPSSNGISEGATPAANTASSPASQSATDDARPALTPSTTPRRKKER